MSEKSDVAEETSANVQATDEAKKRSRTSTPKEGISAD